MKQEELKGIVHRARVSGITADSDASKHRHSSAAMRISDTFTAQKHAPKQRYTRRALNLKTPLLTSAGFMTATLFAYTAAVHMDAFAEIYARLFYPVLCLLYGSLFSLLPISLAELAVYAFCLLAAGYIVFSLIRVIYYRRYWYRALLRSVACMLCAVSIILFSFLTLWGFHYYRAPLAVRLGLHASFSTQQELYTLCRQLAIEASQLRESLPEDEEGVLQLPHSTDTLFSMTREGYVRAQSDFPALKGIYARPKPVLYSEGMSYLGIAGIYVPFTFEPNVNIDMPGFNLPFTASHEMAHSIGIAPEEEANFAAFIACTYHDDVYFRYSGVYTALAYTGNALYAESRELYWQATEPLSDAVRRDRAYASAYWASFEGPVSEAQEVINDFYLKANHQEQGTKSYGLVVDLLLDYYRQTGYILPGAQPYGA
ncbi:MAG: DUF3810 domain-containing protein [Christensenellales bacterium]